MNKKVFLLMIVNILLVNKGLGQNLLTFASDNSEIESEETDRTLPNYEIRTANNGRKAKRWQYQSSEKTTNPDNYIVALQSQFGETSDDINAKMWILK